MLAFVIGSINDGGQSSRERLHFEIFESLIKNNSRKRSG
jgi:hypothetical protein